MMFERCECGQVYGTFEPNMLHGVPNKDGVCVSCGQRWPCEVTVATHRKKVHGR